MITLHLDRDEKSIIALRPEGARDATEALHVVQSVMYFPEEVTTREAGHFRVSLRNLLMFLSDVRGRKFREGLFLSESSESILTAFRAAAKCVVESAVLPTLKEEDGIFYARWILLGERDALIGKFADALMRLGGHTALEDEAPHYETAEDAYLAALRNNDGVINWPDVAALRDLAARLKIWRAPLLIPKAERAALCFRLKVPPKDKPDAWLLQLKARPQTRAGLMALGQAANVFEPLCGLKNGKVMLSRLAAESFLNSGARALEAAGYLTEIPATLRGEHITAHADITPIARARAQAGGGVSSQTKLTIHVDGEVVTEEELRFLCDQNSSLVFFRNRWIEVDRFVLREALHALESTQGRRHTLGETMSLALGLGRVGHLRVQEVAAHGWLRGLLNELRGAERFTLLPPPKGLKGTLRDYQVRGFSWLVFLTKWGFGPCLADDMGLGKTIQAIAYILHTRAQKKRGPILVVAPVTVTTNWVRELKRFAPGLRVILHTGATRATGGTFLLQVRKVDVLITGYPLLVKDLRDFASAEFGAIILDEAQRIKNSDTLAATAVRRIPAEDRIALTGTPLENGPEDLWSLEDFLNPGLLGERAEFLREFAHPLNERMGRDVAMRLKRIIEPFMLRRLKTDAEVAAELGTKREIREYTPLSAAQRQSYEMALAQYRADREHDDSASSRAGRILALLTTLKQICDGEGKVARLDELLDDIFAAGESVLLFTQYVTEGKRLREHLQERYGRKFPFLYGALKTAEREKVVAAFNEDPQPSIFLISLRAGGFGLNLVKATHVIHYDRWWNPAVENQATDRAYRIGQTRDVFVHIFISPGTLEDHIDEILESKRRLAGEIVESGEAFLFKMSDHEFDKVVELT